MKYYTGAGDRGNTTMTAKMGVPKDDPRMEVNGNIDELESIVGVAITRLEKHAGVTEALLEIQNFLHVASAEIADPSGKAKTRDGNGKTKIDSEHVKWLEELCDRLGSKTKPVTGFVLVGGSPGGATLHLARAVARRAERSLVTLRQKESVSAELLAFINRLSSALFVLARYVNEKDGYREVNPRY